MTATPAPALEKILETVLLVELAVIRLRETEEILLEQTNGSTRSGLPDVQAALYNLVGDDPEAEPVLGHLRAVLAMNRTADAVRR